MKQNTKKRQTKNSQKIVKKNTDSEKTDQTEITFSPRVEKIYKILLRTMSWIVGSALILVIVLFYFNSPKIDQFSQAIFYIGIVTLLVFIIIELVGHQFKNFLSKFINE